MGLSMAAYTGSVWAIEIGNESLKALKLGAADSNVQVLDFNNIPYGKVLSSPGITEIEKDELIALSLRQFARDHDLGKDPVIIAVPSQNSFARFVNLPPVEEKKMDQVVQLEAGMQIPFDMSEVQWDWQLMSKPNEEQTRIGIFAIKNETVTHELEYLINEDIHVSTVQMSPMALYNYVLFDRPELFKSDRKAVAVINIGAENTDLVVCTRSGVWQRCIPMGGNSFTNAISEAFKINFSKAEKLKRSAAMSKYARQVFQAMRPVFTDFAGEVQRSLGFYGNSNPDSKITHIVALGGGTKLRGLLKYLQQTLQISVERLDSFRKVQLTEDVSSAKYGENINNLAVVYGLGLQELGLGKIESNLLPRAIASSMAMANKAKFITLGTIALLIISILSVGRIMLDSARYKKLTNERNQINRIIAEAEDADSLLNEQESRGVQSQALIDKANEMFQHREIIPSIYNLITSSLPDAYEDSLQKELYEAFHRGDVATVLKTPRKQRRQLFITGIKIKYVDNIAAASLDQSFSELSTSKFGSKPERNIFMEEEAGQAINGPGFVIAIAGYSPYEFPMELLDPAGIGDDKRKWGLVTWLAHPNEIVDGNCPFRIYDKTKSEHFEPIIRPVVTGTTMPQGIGQEKVEIQLDNMRDSRAGYRGDNIVLVDPMTRETISSVPITDEQGNIMRDKSERELYKTNDQWFVLNFKLLWLKDQSDLTDTYNEQL